MESWAWAGAGLGVAAAGTWVAARLLRPGGIPVLRYTLVGPPRAGSPLNDLRLPMSRFRAQLKHLARRGFRAVTLGEALAQRGQRRFLASNPVVLTFDGPWRGFLTSVWPALSEYGLTRVTLFFPAQRLGQGEIRYTDGRPEPLLQNDELRTLSGDGVEVGLLSPDDIGGKLSAVARQWREESDALSAVVGADVRLLAYPPRVTGGGFARAAQQAGFDAAVQVGGGGVLTRWSPRLVIPRYPVQPGTDLVHLAFCLARRR